MNAPGTTPDTFYCMAMIVLGLDGEMSGSEVGEGDVLVQIGAAFSVTERYSSLIGWPEGSYHSTEAGMAAHGISPADIAAARPAAEVDAELSAWLIAGLAARGLGTDAKRLVPVGFNVGAFDMPFVRANLPLTYGLLSRRVIDLNAFCMGYAMSGRLLAGTAPKWSGWKRLAVTAAERQIRAAGIEEQRHDAGYDAVEAVLALEFLLDPK